MSNVLRIPAPNDPLRPVTEHVTLNEPTGGALPYDHATRVAPIAKVTSSPDRIRWASALAGLAMVVSPVVMAGCGSADSPAVPSSLAPTGTPPAVTIGAGVPLKPGSNLPPVEGEGQDETVTTSTG